MKFKYPVCLCVTILYVVLFAICWTHYAKLFHKIHKPPTYSNFPKKEENVHGVIKNYCNLFLFIIGSEKKHLFNETIVLLSTGIFVF